MLLNENLAHLFNVMLPVLPYEKLDFPIYELYAPQLYVPELYARF